MLGLPCRFCCGAWASYCKYFSCFGSGALGCESFSSCCCVGVVASWNVESFQTWDWTGVPCIGRWILNHRTTRKSYSSFSLKYFPFLKRHKLFSPYVSQKIKHCPPNGLPLWLRWQSICLQCRRPEFNPWVGKISWRRKWQPTPVFLPGKSSKCIETNSWLMKLDCSIAA